MKLALMLLTLITQAFNGVNFNVSTGVRPWDYLWLV